MKRILSVEKVKEVSTISRKGPTAKEDAIMQVEIDPVVN